MCPPFCEIEEDTTEHVLRCGGDTTDRKQRNIKNNTEEEWEEVVPDIQLEIKQKKKRRQKRESLGRKHSHESFRFGCLVQHYEQ